MIYCNNRNCEKGTLFHLERIRMKEDDVTDDDDWFCSEKFRQKRVVKENYRFQLQGFLKMSIWRDFLRGFEQYGQA